MKREGESVVAGTPEKVAEQPTSHMGKYLKQVLGQHPPQAVLFEGGVGGVREGLGVAWVVA